VCAGAVVPLLVVVFLASSRTGDGAPKPKPLVVKPAPAVDPAADMQAQLRAERAVDHQEVAFRRQSRSTAHPTSPQTAPAGLPVWFARYAAVVATRHIARMLDAVTRASVSDCARVSPLEVDCTVVYHGRPTCRQRLQITRSARRSHVLRVRRIPGTTACG
jgi:hypothetical protein